VAALSSVLMVTVPGVIVNVTIMMKAHSTVATMSASYMTTRRFALLLTVC
jgi:hypothetical protein